METDPTCYCGSGRLFKECCSPYINGINKAPTAEALMRSRYSAYVVQAADYLVATTDSSRRKYHSKSDILEWSKSNNWLRLEIISAAQNSVEFKAYFLDSQLQAQVHHERSTFRFDGTQWFYVDGTFY